VGVHKGISLLHVQSAVHELVHELTNLGVRGVKRVSSDVEDAPVMLDGPAKASDVVVSFQNERISL
jgi:hypothetical protein